MIVAQPMFKATTEIWDFATSFEPWLVAGQTLVSAVFRAMRESDGADATRELEQQAATIIAGPTLPSSAVSQVIKGGESRQTYLLQIKATDSIGRVWLGERRLVIQDRRPIITSASGEISESLVMVGDT